jgi:hypothetical protein
MPSCWNRAAGPICCGPKAIRAARGPLSGRVDQHRGWFQSSLLEACATRGHAPYKGVLTHGFTMDAKGLKMSKSLGNTISPIDLMRDYGADILRLWALSVDFTEDHRIGKEILAGVADQYRKLRNTFRYLLGALDGFGEDEKLPVGEMPELERYMLVLLERLDGTLRQAVADYDYNTYVRALSEFCNEDLSAFFFDIRKDSLYCDAPGDPKRRAYRTVLDVLFHALVRYAAPVLVFTAEEVWQTRFPGSDSVHLLEWPVVPVSVVEEDRWAELRALRTTVNEAIEPLRREKVLGSGLEAQVLVPEGAPEADLAELFITGTVVRGQDDGVTVTRTHDHKCGRCWRHLPEVAEDGALCARCETVVAELDGKRRDRFRPPPCRLRAGAAHVRGGSRRQGADDRPARAGGRGRNSAAAVLRLALDRELRRFAGHVHGNLGRDALWPDPGDRRDRAGRGRVDAARKGAGRYRRPCAGAGRGAGQYLRPRLARLRDRLRRPSFRGMAPVPDFQHRRCRHHLRRADTACPVAAFARKARQWRGCRS